MKIYTKGILLITLILLGGLQNAFAQTCGLPATTSIWANETTPTSIEIEWMPITGAVNYEIITEEVSTGTIISTVVQPGTIYLATGLQPATDYVFTIRGLCANGEGGDHRDIYLPTGVIVVDVIVQVECPPNGPPVGPSGTQWPGTTGTYHFNQNPVLAFTGTITGPNIPFKIIVDDQTIMPGSFRNGNTVGTTQPFLPSLSFQNTNSPSVVQVSYDTPNGPIPFADITPSTGTKGKVIIDWIKQVDVTATYCSLATWQGDDNGGPGGDGGNKGSKYGLVMAPNPASEFVNISSDVDTPLQITDLYGTPWHDGEVLIGEDLYLDISFWPAGTYIVSYFDGYEMQAEQLIKL